MAKRQATQDFFAFLDAKYPTIIEGRNDATDKPTVKAISTGSPSLDIATGIGGIPTRMFTEIFGPESSAKTTLAITTAYNAILSGRRALYIDAEHSLDMDRVKAITGPEMMDSKRFVVVRPNSMEEALNLCEIGIRDANADFGFVGLDSIASMAPMSVKEKELTDSSPYVLPKMLTQFVQRNISTIWERDVAFLGVNQVRDDTSNPYIKTYSTPGGHQWKHILSLRIQLSKIADIKVGDKTMGISVKFLIKKSKVGPPLRSSTIPVMFENGIDYYMDLLNFSTSLGIVNLAGPYYKFGTQTLGRGFDDASEALKQDKELLDKIKEMCYNTYNKQAVISDESLFEE